MRLRISTAVKSSLQEVEQGFTQELFLKLNPPFPKVKILRFDGCKQGDLVSLELNFLISKQNWVSEITYDRTDSSVFEFVDEGRKLPFPFSQWKHHHIVKTEGKSVLIIDDIDFMAYNKVFSLLVYPLLWLQFMYRKPVYRKVFHGN